MSINITDYLLDSSSEEEIIDLKYIIENKPSYSIVREFFNENMKNIIDPEELEFEKELLN